MKARIIATLAVLANLLPVGCVQPVAVKTTPTPSPAAKATSPVATSQPVARALVVGQVIAPAGYSAGGIIANDGASVISNDGASIISGGAGNMRLLALAEQPLAGAEVYLGDAAGNPIPDLQRARTDAKGNYRLTGKVPDGTYTVMVPIASARKAAGYMQTLVKTSEAGTTADVGTASTCVTMAVVEGLGGTLGAFNPVTFKAATDATAMSLTTANAPDLTDRAAVRSWMQALSRDVAEIKSLLGEIVQELRDLRAAVDKLSEKVDKSPAPAPVASASATATATPALLQDEYAVTFTLQAATATTEKLWMLIKVDTADPEADDQREISPGGRATVDLASESYPASYKVYIAPPDMAGDDMASEQYYQGQIVVTRHPGGFVTVAFDSEPGKPFSLTDLSLMSREDGSAAFNERAGEF